MTLSLICSRESLITIALLVAAATAAIFLGIVVMFDMESINAFGSSAVVTSNPSESNTRINLSILFGNGSVAALNQNISADQGQEVVDFLNEMLRDNQQEAEEESSKESGSDGGGGGGGDPEPVLPSLGENNTNRNPDQGPEPEEGAAAPAPQPEEPEQGGGDGGIQLDRCMALVPSCEFNMSEPQPINFSLADPSDDDKQE